MTCVEPGEGLSGTFDEGCQCWLDTTLFGFGTHSAVVPGDGSVEVVYDGQTLATDHCMFPDPPPMLPLTSCETGTQATVDRLPSGFCFDVTATTTAAGGLDQVSHTHTFCAPS